MVPRVWLITGCSPGGFGGQLAQEVLSRGDKVIATARNEAKLAELLALGADTIALNVTSSPEELAKIAGKVLETHGRLDVLVNNAGYMVQGTVEELTPQEVQQQFDTNVFGLLNVTRAFLPIFRHQKSGTIVNFSSLGAWRGTAGLGIYAGSKWAVSAISEALTAEVAELGITVTSIEPGYFRSKLLAATNTVAVGPRIPDYDGTLARRNMERWSTANGTQPGDIAKAAKVIVDVVTQTGSAKGKGIPVRLLLGSDAYGIVTEKCTSYLRDFGEWEAVTKSTDY